MPHMIETHGDQAAFFSFREDAWHSLGNVVDNATTAEEALQLAHLTGWNVRKVGPLTTTVLASDGTLQVVEVPDKFAIVRDNPFEPGKVDVLGDAGKVYEPIQNEAKADLLNAILGEGDAQIETAGSLKGGREVFVTMKVPGTMQVGGVDPVDLYIAALNNHDGQKSFRFLVTPIRVVCKNTQSAAVKAAKSSFSVRHTKNGTKGVVAQAREALDLTFRYAHEFELEAEKMIQEALTEAAFNEIVKELVPLADNASDLLKARAEKTRGTLMELFTDSPTNTAIRGTNWAGYNAVTEYVDHVQTFNRSTGIADPERRAAFALSADGIKTKEFAFKLLQVA